MRVALSSMSDHSHPWIAGIDIGGSGMRISLSDKRGSVIDASPLSLDHSRPLHGIPELLQAVTFSHGIDNVSHVAVSMTGYPPSSSDVSELGTHLERTLSSRWLLVGSDGLAAYHGAHGLNPGVVCAAGTGTIIMARDAKGKIHQVDGHGPIAGDYGSGFWIGQRALRSALRARDRGEKSSFSPLLTELETALAGGTTQINLPAHRALVAAFAPYVLTRVNEDPEAERIASFAADHLAASVALAAQNSENSNPALAFTGRLFHNKEFLFSVRKRIHSALPHSSVIERLVSPLEGATLLAAAGEDPSDGKYATTYVSSRP